MRAPYIVDELNEELLKNPYFEDNCLFFRAIYDGSYWAVSLGDQILYYEDNDMEWDDEKDIQIPAKETIIKKFNEYVKALKTVNLKP